MAEHNETEAGQATPRRPFWMDRRVWSLVVAVAIVVTFLNDHQKFLGTVEKASFNAAAYIDQYLSPGSFQDAFHERAAKCDYHWLFFCERPTPAICRHDALGLPECVPGADGYSVLDPDRYRPRMDAVDIFSTFWSGVLTLGQLPDTTWYVFKKAYGQGWLTFSLLFAFAAINVIIATRAPLIALPIVFPISVAISSGLFWLLQQFLIWTANGVGVVFWCLLGIATLPGIIVFSLGGIAGEHGLRDFIHQVRAALGLVKEVMPGRH